MSPPPSVDPRVPTRRGPSRRVRLRRTIVGAVLLGVLVVTGIRLAGGEGTGLRPPATSAGDQGSASTTHTAAPTTRPASAAPNSEDGSKVTETAEPGGPVVPQNGTGKIRVVQVPPMDNPVSTGREITYTVEVEDGLGVDAQAVARTIQSVLLDRRGWQSEDDVRFVNITPEQSAAGRHVDIRVTLASPGLTDRLCAPLRTLSQVSCWNGERSVLNFRRWALGAASYGKNVATYRIYQVNHEVGHGLGHQHEACPATGARAPIMVQQTLSLQGCKAWPFPTGA